MIVPSQSSGLRPPGRAPSLSTNTAAASDSKKRHTARPGTGLSSSARSHIFRSRRVYLHLYWISVIVKPILQLTMQRSHIVHEDSARGKVETSCPGHTDDELGIARKACCSGVAKASNVCTPLLALSRLQTNARNGHDSKDRLKIVCP